MKIKTFRVVKFKKGFLTFYAPQVKTFFGWFAFKAYTSTGFNLDNFHRCYIGHIFYGNGCYNDNLQDCLKDIESYRLIKGFEKEQIYIKNVVS
jgi:hypothetical protein